MVVKIPESHNKCLLCGEKNRLGMNLKFDACDDESVVTTLNASSAFQGYDGILHGGFIASIMDCAMCHALFNLNIEAVTGDMKISFHKEIPYDSTLVITAKVLNKRGPLYKTEASVLIDGVAHASSVARFVNRTSTAKVK